MSAPPPNLGMFADCVDLLDEDLGGTALFCTDDFFAEVGNLVHHAPAAFDPNAYTDRGKLMDGWESRRKRVPGHDHAVLRLGVRGLPRGVDIDTSFFLGNHPPFASLSCCDLPDGAPDDEASLRKAPWRPLLPQVPLLPGSHNVFAIAARDPVTHVRLDIFPDGGVARLRLLGEPMPRTLARTDGLVDLAAIAHGGRALACNDAFFGRMQNLLLPKPPLNMSSGWETKRRSGPWPDWVVIRIVPGTVSRVLLDTAWFKGNFPESACVDGLYWPGGNGWELSQSDRWQNIVPWTKLRPDSKHELAVPATLAGPYTHLRLQIRPDGGIARFRAFGEPVEAPDALVTLLNSLDPASCDAALRRCCASLVWADRLAAERPFRDRDELFEAADDVWWALGEADWDEAFSAHPRIGADAASLRARYGDTARWSQREQAGVTDADVGVIEALADGNRAYEARFGRVFLICATGKPAGEMLAALHERLRNDPSTELRVAAAEQAKIARIRLAKLVEE